MEDFMVVMLDSGEDKADTHKEYAGLNDFESYRTEQADWLKKLIKSKEYKNAGYRIIICHFPMVMDRKWQDEKMWLGWQDAIDKFLPILNDANVDLLVSGHTHRCFYHEKGVADNLFPVLEQGWDNATRLDIRNGKVDVKVVGMQGNILLEKVLY